MAAALTICETRETWLALRGLGVGASEVPAVLGVSPYMTPLTLFGLKIGVLEPREETERMKLGRHLEPVVAALYQDETGRTLQDLGPYTIQRDPTVSPVLFATLDRLVSSARGVGVLELKTTGGAYADGWADEPPLHVQVQVQAQLAVTGLAWASVAALIGGQRFVWVDLDRNEVFIQAMLTAVRAFWTLVERRTPPPAVSARDLVTLRALYATDTGGSVDLPDDAITWDQEWQEGKAQLAHWHTIVDEAEAKLKFSIGPASVGILPDGRGRYTWKTSIRHDPPREARDLEVRTFRRQR